LQNLNQAEEEEIEEEVVLADLSKKSYRNDEKNDAKLDFSSTDEEIDGSNNDESSEGHQDRENNVKGTATTDSAAENAASAKMQKVNKRVHRRWPKFDNRR
jgi:hypothetical protein